MSNVRNYANSRDDGRQPDEHGLIVLGASGAAWRARYVYWGTSLQSSRKIAHLGIDPTAARPNVFGSIGGKEFRVALPILRYKHAAGPLRSRLYMMQARILGGLDGRYGWGREVQS